MSKNRHSGVNGLRDVPHEVRLRFVQSEREPTAAAPTPATTAWPGNVALAAMAIPSMQMEGVVTSLLEAEGTTLVRNRDLHRP